MATGVLPTQLSAAASSYEEKPAVISPLRKSENKVKIPRRSLCILQAQTTILIQNPFGNWVNFSGDKNLEPENILSHIAFFFTLFKGYRCN